jgi:hypothetical protein
MWSASEKFSIHGLCQEREEDGRSGNARENGLAGGESAFLLLANHDLCSAFAKKCEPRLRDPTGDEDASVRSWS